MLAVAGAAVAATAVLIGSDALSGGEQDRTPLPDRGTAAPTATFPTDGDDRPSQNGAHSPSAPPTGPMVLREGSSGPEVVELQDRLRQLAIYPAGADGRYDADVRAAVARFQQVYGVTGDPEGVYGAATRASLEARTSRP